MRDSEIRESADLLRVLQRIREKQNEELICLTLAVPLKEGLEQRIQLLLQQRKQVDVSYRIADVSPPTTDAAEEWVDAGLDRDVEVFSGSSRVTSTGSIVCTFLVNEELVPIKIERITGHYRLFNLFFYNLCLLYR